MIVERCAARWTFEAAPCAAAPLPRERVVCYDDRVGPGCSPLTPEMIETVALAAEFGGILHCAGQPHSCR